ncbi:Npun_F0494 family protein [Gloeobacter kilaueensis]|uniref:Uncharacterized protein n=1 Tax=Gloeobacter kilaueensis (strain ATCC BAA-2537 / CCAP 1431/1 / ULC 316 / JS1) TaxID=1183438 RepID=U5QLE0_GLOK1|nr:Npun_F0494 family protein [Gloeobacter kilaueensis]AGY58485.1 hypothetical protein GKIL_2239 [Gloeobacter kilaueensis JS1]
MDFQQQTIERAERAIRLGAILPAGLVPMAERSVAAAELAGRSGLQLGYTRQALSAAAVEAELMWLFKVGVVRREVDGQGITDRFRLTPLGAQVLVRLKDTHSLAPLTLVDAWHNQFTRWLS